MFLPFLSFLFVIVYSFCIVFFAVFFFKQKTAYDMRISDWSSDVCSSDLPVDMPLFERLCHPQDRERIREEIARAIAGEDDGEFCTTYRVLFDDGSLRWMETRGQAFFEGGQCSRFVGVVMDITEQQLANQTLRTMNETLGERVQGRTREQSGRGVGGERVGTN